MYIDRLILIIVLIQNLDPSRVQVPGAFKKALRAILVNYSKANDITPQLLKIS